MKRLIGLNISLVIIFLSSITFSIGIGKSQVKKPPILDCEVHGQVITNNDILIIHHPNDQVTVISNDSFEIAARKEWVDFWRGTTKAYNTLVSVREFHPEGASCYFIYKLETGTFDFVNATGRKIVHTWDNSIRQSQIVYHTFRMEYGYRVFPGQKQDLTSWFDFLGNKVGLDEVGWHLYQIRFCHDYCFIKFPIGRG